MIEVWMYFFGLLILVSGLTLIFTENLIYAAFLLALCLLSIAGFYVIYNASFLAVIQILIYAGGILILIAFGIMLTKRSPEGKVIVGYHLLFFGFLVTLGMALLIYALVGKFDDRTPRDSSNYRSSKGDWYTLFDPVYFGI